MESQRGMWAEAWVQSVVARKFVALAVIGDMALRMSAEWFEIHESVVSVIVGTFVSTFLWAYLAYAVHAQILLPHDRSSRTSHARVFGFALRSAGIGILIGIAVLGIVIAVILLTFILGKVIGAQLPRVIEVIVLLAGLALALTVFVRLGTLLPAYVAGRVGGVDAAMKRGKMQFRWIAGRLLIGPCLLLGVSGALYSLLPIPAGEYSLFWNEERVFLPVNVLGHLLFNIVQAFVTALTAIILSRAFLRVEGMPGTAAV